MTVNPPTRIHEQHSNCRVDSQWCHTKNDNKSAEIGFVHEWKQAHLHTVNNADLEETLEHAHGDEDGDAGVGGARCKDGEDRCEKDAATEQVLPTNAVRQPP